MWNPPRRRARWWRGSARQVGFYKVGMELYAAAGMDFVRELLDRGQRRLPRSEALRHSRNREARGGAGGAHGRALPHRARRAVGDARGGRGPGELEPPTAGRHRAHQLRPRGSGDLGYACEVSELVARRARKAMEAGMDGMVGFAAGSRRGAPHRRPGRDPGDARGALGRRRARATRSAWPRPPKPCATAPTTW